MSRKFAAAAFGLLALIVLGFGGAYIASPYLAVQSLMQAVKNGDTDSIEDHVDFPTVRDHLKSQVSTALLSKLQDDPDLKDNPFVGLGAMLAPAITDRLIDSYVTPEGLAQVIKSRSEAETPAVLPLSSSVPTSAQTSRAPAPNNTGAAPVAPVGAAHSPQPHPATTMSYEGLDRFKVTVGDQSNPASKLNLIFERRGMFGWKMVRLDIPTDAFTDAAGGRSASASSTPTPRAMPDADSTGESDRAQPPTDIPPDVKPILDQESVDNEACRGGSGDDPATDAACKRRDADDDQLTAKGWCYGEGAIDGAHSFWAPCRGKPPG